MYVGRPLETEGRCNLNKTHLNEWQRSPKKGEAGEGAMTGQSSERL